MTSEDLVKLLGGPAAQVVAIAALTVIGLGIVIAYTGKRDAALRAQFKKELEDENDERMTKMEKRVEALERRCTEARAINVECVAEAATLGAGAIRLRELLVRQAAVLG